MIVINNFFEIINVFIIKEKNVIWNIIYLYNKRKIYGLCNNHHDNEIKIKNLRLYQKSDSEILRY